DFNSKNFKIIFNGRHQEYADILEEVQYLNKNGWEINSELVYLMENKNVIKELDIYIKDIIKNAPMELNEELKDKKALEEFEFAKNSEAEVSILATMSSGKSTLLNALLGKEVLPSKNEACTSTICRIKDVNKLEKFRLKAETIDGEIISDWADLDNENVKKLNEAGHIKPINLFIEGNIPGIKSEEMNLILIDTPGPNNSQNIEHKEATYKFIKDTKNNPLVLYVMNATQHGTNDDARLLSEISEIVKNNGKQAEERFIFALNKIDCFDPEKESIEILVENSKNYLKGFGIENPKIFPISAEGAKLVRLRECGQELSRVQKGNLSTFEYNFLPEEDYLGIDTIKYASISELAKEKLYEESKLDRTKGLLHYSGITAIELYIEKYVNKYAETQKIKDSVNTLKKVVDYTYSEVNLLSGKTAENIEEIVMQINSIEKILKSKGKSKISNVKKQINELKGDLNEYSSFFLKIEKEFLKIEKELDEEKVTEQKAELIIFEVNKNLENLVLGLKTSANKIANEQIYLNARLIINELKKYFSDILGEINIDNELKNVLESKIELEIPTVSALLKEGVYTLDEVAGKIIVGTKSNATWWNPFTWFDRIPIYEDLIEKKSYVNLLIIKEKYLTKQKQIIRKAINTAQKEMLEKIEILKKESLDKLLIVETNIEQKIKELKIKAENKENLLNEKTEFEKKLKLITLYKNKLDRILNV
ncbi:MAG: dynamin family protein, partial [Fusobacteriaceae bacterium]